MKESKEVISLLISLLIKLENDLQDKKVDASELIAYLPLLLKVPEAIKDINKVDDEWKASSFEQKQSFIKEIEVEFDIKNDNLENIIESSLKIILEVSELVKKIKA